MKERPQVNIRLDRELLDQIDALAEAEHVDRSDVARRLIGSGLTTYRMEKALHDYRRGAISQSKAAQVAGVSLYDMLDRIHAEGIPYEMDPEVLQRLDARQGLHAVRETGAPYGGGSDGDNGIDALRAQFRPAVVKTLFVGESSPAGGTHFYRANSNLFRATREAFASAYGAANVPDGIDFLAWFRDQGCWLVDLADRPVNRLDRAQREQTVGHGTARLAETIRATQPAVIVAVKATIGSELREAASIAGWFGDLVELPFPVRQWRTKYIARLSQFLRSDTE
jgi:hypothetical protein